MHCFACDALLDNPKLDEKTSRYYCLTCLEPTFELLLAQDQASLRIEELAQGGLIKALEFLPSDEEFEDIHFVTQKDTSDSESETWNT